MKVLEQAAPRPQGVTESPIALSRPLAFARPGTAPRSESVVSLPEAKVERERSEWLHQIQGYSQLDIAYDPAEGILWCFMDPKERPSVTPALASESLALQRSIVEHFSGASIDGVWPLRYLVWGSRLPGVFNLGGDLPLFASLIRERNRAKLMDYATTCVDVVYGNATNLGLPIITISLVQGDALGGGFEAAISGDLVIAERSAKFGLPEVLFNLFPGMGAYSLLSRRIGAAQAERMILSGRVYTAEELHEMGLVHVLADDGEGEHAVYDYVARHTARHAAECAVYRAGRRVNPLSYEELYDITKMWVEAALTLTDSDLRKMERLAAAQDRRHARVRRAG